MKVPCAANLFKLVGGLALTGAVVAAPATAGASPVINRAYAERSLPASRPAVLRAGGARDATSTAAGQPGIAAFGTASTYGYVSASMFSSPVVGIAATPNGQGYWVATSDGGVFTFGDATFHGSLVGQHLAQQVVGMATTPDGKGYWLATASGGVYSFGDARFYGSLGDKQISAPVDAIVPTPSGQGYWVATSDGGVFTFGDATFHGSLAGQHPQPVVAMAATPDAKGYWLATASGGVYSFGDARFYGSLGDKQIPAPVDAIAATPSGHGYWLASTNGGVFTFGDATFHGSLGANALTVPVVGIAPTPNGNGYWLATSVVSRLSRCKAGQLSVAFEPAESTGGAAGSVGLTYQFTNKSAYSCTLHGYPGLQMLGPQRRPLATHLQRRPATGPIPTVTLPPKGNAWFQIEYPTQTGYANLHCPTSTSVEVTPPNAYHQVHLTTGPGAHLQPYGGTIGHLQCGQISITPVASAPPVGPSPSSFPALEVCGLGAPVTEPKSFTIACGDGNSRAEDLTWTHWGATSAVGKGTFTWNLCVPYCAASKTWGTRPATFTLSTPKSTSRGLLFETLTVKLEGSLPKGMERVQVYSEAPVSPVG